jgi:precorrin-6Y C5,15-methyltransferase (decarboxylating)
LTDPCALIGILDDGWAGLSDTARTTLRASAVVIGAERTLALVDAHLPASTRRRAMDGALAAVPGWINEHLDADARCAVLVTGDPLCHGLGDSLGRQLPPGRLRVLPALSTLQLLFARLGRPWQDVAIGSAHTRDTGEWQLGATPAHALYPLIQQIARHRRVAAFTSPHNSPDRIARALLAAGFEADTRMSVGSRLCLPDETVLPDLPLTDAAQRSFDDPNVILVERTENDRRATFGFADDDYVQRQPEKGLITKREVRAVSLAHLALRPDSRVWDIGAGSGSVGLEAARIARDGHVWAIEKNAADAANALENARRLRATNYTLVQDRAPSGMADWPAPDAVFIGGSGGELASLITQVLARLRPGGRLVMNFVTIESLATATAALTSVGADWHITQLSTARSQPILDMHRLAAQNPVWIVSVIKDSP